MIDAYYSRKEVSNSDLTALKNQIKGGQKHDPTEAYAFGGLVDALITEPKEVDYFRRMHRGHSFSKEDFNKASAMAKSFLEHEICAPLVKNCEYQKVSVKRRKLSYNGVPFELDCRCKWDFFGNVSGDIKTITEKTQKEFLAAIEHFDYDRQRAWYMDLENTNVDVLIGISKVNHKRVL